MKNGKPFRAHQFTTWAHEHGHVVLTRKLTLEEWPAGGQDEVEIDDSVGVYLATEVERERSEHAEEVAGLKRQIQELRDELEEWELPTLFSDRQRIGSRALMVPVPSRFVGYEVRVTFEALYPVGRE